MSTAAGADRKRKPSDVNPGSSPASKHIKVENTGIMASAGMGGNPAMAIAAQRRAQLQQLLNAQPGMAEETKHKYLSGLDGLRLVVEKHGVNSQEGQAAQNKYDMIVNKLRSAVRVAQQGFQPQPHQQNGGGMVNNGTMPGAGPNVGAPVAGNVMNPTSRSNWIVPPTVPPANADQWRADIQVKLTQVGQKMNHARAQIGILQQNQQQPGITPEQQREIQNKISEHTQQYNHFKEIINKFGQQQKILQQQQQQQVQLQQQQLMLQAQQAQQARASQQQGQQGQIPMQSPVQQGIVPEAHNPSQQQQQQQGTIQQQQANTGNNVQQNPQNNHPLQQQQQQQPLQSANPMQQQQQQQQRPPQQPPQQNTHVVANPQQQQRIATPVQRADSPPGPVPNPTVNRATMSPAAQQPPMQQQQQHQPTQQPQPQPQQQQQQQGQVQTAARPPIQPPSQQPQQQPTIPGRSSVPPVAAGTPMAQPNSPAPRAGSVQPGARPPTAAGTPVSATPQQPGQPQPQGQPQQQAQQRMQPASSASAASPTTNAHLTQTTRDTAQGHRLPIPKSLAVAAPQPIAMPAARPTLSGGMNSSGNQMMSTPAIIKQPAFEFDEGGMGLLSKRKLEELVKQIDPEERLDPDVEESILELVDEFIDNIATTACKMAKLRGSDTLDIKDIQIILERNWNIRIPGYAADDIRTVRKFNPAPGYHQKMATLAAHKQLNQASGKGSD